mmetsp:Transcript_71199/g.148912  ORF Transcript_71199/g.148912 Transcript_71199/m.148912 type:complete len:87 (+) Transcript_71199:1997-2257(+)
MSLKLTFTWPENGLQKTAPHTPHTVRNTDAKMMNGIWTSHPIKRSSPNGQLLLPDCASSVKRTVVDELVVVVAVVVVVVADATLVT